VKIPALLFILLITLMFPYTIFSEEQDGGETIEEIYHPVSPLRLFYHFGTNALHSLTFNYGANFIGAGLGTWAFIESGLDWKWRNFGYKHEAFANIAYSAVIYAGYVIPTATPVAFYITGLFIHDEKLQIAGLAMLQSLALANTAQVILKLTTGRSEPYLINQYHHERITASDDFSGKFNWFKNGFLDGWPSGHTLSAFASATALAQIYNDNLFIQIAAYSFASIIGLGVSFNVHWASDVLAGALIGYAVGAAVGRDFRQLLKPEAQHDKVLFSITAQPLGVLVRF
jgi:membrane-associated phospholipid phosphatase